MAIIAQQVGNVEGGFLGAGFTAEEVLFGEFTYYYVGQVDTYGAVQHTSGITLPRNALVEEFDVLVTAARATAVHANVVGQVRAGPSSDTAVGSQGLSVVVDFGTPRTVNAVTVPSSYQIAAVKIWNGAQFVEPGIYRTFLASSALPPHDLILTPPNPTSTAARAVLPAEPRTERLLIEVVGSTSDAGPLIEELSVALPDAPGDLELRINGGAPAWLHPGPVPPAQGTTPSEDAWNADAERIVPLADALGALTGESDGERRCHVRAEAHQPVAGAAEGGGAFAPDQTHPPRDVRRPRHHHDRVRRGGRGRSRAQRARSAIGHHRVRDTADHSGGRFRKRAVLAADRSGAIPDRRSPEADQERAVLIRLAADAGLAELTGLRLPLAAGDDGAELRVVLWSNAEPGVALPTAPIDDATSEPMVLDAGSADAFRTFSFGSAGCA